MLNTYTRLAFFSSIVSIQTRLQPVAQPEKSRLCIRFRIVDTISSAQICKFNGDLTRLEVSIFKEELWMTDFKIV